jgi:hypothetical protein
LSRGYLKKLQQLFPNDYGDKMILADFDLKEGLESWLNCAVWDIESGALLKLGKRKEIVRAIHGY